MLKTSISEETLDFLKQYVRENELDETWLTKRLEEIQILGYRPTTEELVFGARLAWRNSNKCIGRLFWESLEVFDRRELLNEQEIFEALVEHLWFATNKGKIKPAISIFETGRVRIWNHQLVRYAGYEKNGVVVGDPDSVEFTNKCIELGWQGSGTNFDILPIVIQVDGKEPIWFELPKEAVLEVDITHPDFKEFEKLGLRWYAVPLLTDLKFECAGITYEAAPFNGWYMGTEIGARNLADNNRYNKLPEVADVLGIKKEGNISLWKDRALVELNVAVLYSFKKAGVSIVDHHTAAQQFGLFQQQEQMQGREVTGNWVWLIPPLSPATTHIFHSPIENKKLKPNYWGQKKPY